VPTAARRKRKLIGTVRNFRHSRHSGIAVSDACANDARMRACFFAVLLILGLASSSAAQGLFGASPHQPPRDDRTGTNPLNLQQQIDVSNSYLTLDTLYLNITTYRHALPLFHRRVRVAGLFPFGVTNLTGTKDGGIGDVGADVEWTPWLGEGTGLVAGLRTTWDTSTSEGLGYGGKNTLMPYAQYVRQLSPRVLLAPFFGYRLSAGGEDFASPYKDAIAGAMVVWRASDRTWVATTPQIVFDLEHDRTYGDVGGEVGYMLFTHVGTWIRPTIGFGSSGQKPYSWGIVGGVRIVP